MKGFLIVLIAAVAHFALAGTLTVTSPTSGSSLGSADSPYLGKNNTLTFLITGSSVEVTVKAEITSPAGTTVISDKFQPDSKGEISRSLALNFSESSPEGNYTIVVSATEPGNSYPTKTLYVKVDTRKPKILEFSPNNSAFVRGTVPIRATIQELNIKDWTVRVGNQDIPSNTGTTNEINVPWDTTGIITDGAQSITLTVRDLADNVTTQTINVTLDRISPVATILFPRSDTSIRPNATISVIVDVRDASSTSVDAQGIDVILTRLDGTYIARVSRVSYGNAGGNTARWNGRIRYVQNRLPSQFKVRVTVVDKAGNSGIPQEVIVTVR
ncbi:MAG: hypothetical protein ACOYON_14500 [Fimbriimonas sp.]